MHATPEDPLPDSEDEAAALVDAMSSVVLVDSADDVVVAVEVTTLVP